MVDFIAQWPEFDPQASPTNEPFPTPLDQEVVANFGLSQKIGGKLMIACRIPTNDTAKLIRSLESKEYKALLLGAKGLTREKIAEAMAMPVYTTQEYRASAYNKLGVPEDPEEAASFIPMSHDYFEEFGLDRLSKSDRDILMAIGEGLSYTEIAERYYMPKSTVRSYKSRLAKELGINGNADLASLRLRRLGGALFTLESKLS